MTHDPLCVENAAPDFCMCGAAALSRQLQADINRLALSVLDINTDEVQP